MKYIDALRKYNEGKDKWCIPRKGTEDYLKIRMMMRMKSKSSSSSSSSSSTSIAKQKDTLELLNVSGRNNNCFFNSIYLFVKDADDSEWKSGSELRRFLCDLFLQPQNIKKTIRNFKTYLELVQVYSNDGMGLKKSPSCCL